jgi:hypothetical protein
MLLLQAIPADRQASLIFASKTGVGHMVLDAFFVPGHIDIYPDREQS